MLRIAAISLSVSPAHRRLLLQYVVVACSPKVYHDYIDWDSTLSSGLLASFYAIQAARPANNPKWSETNSGNEEIGGAAFYGFHMSWLSWSWDRTKQPA